MELKHKEPVNQKQQTDYDPFIWKGERSEENIWKGAGSGE